MSKCRNCKHSNRIVLGYVMCDYYNKGMKEKETCAAQELISCSDTYMRASNYIKDVKGEQK